MLKRIIVGAVGLALTIGLAAVDWKALGATAAATNTDVAGTVVAAGLVWDHGG